MDKRPASKLSLDSLMSRVLPSLESNVPSTTDGSKKFKRVRPVEGAAVTAVPTAAAVTLPATGYVNMNPTTLVPSTSSTTTTTTNSNEVSTTPTTASTGKKNRRANKKRKANQNNAPGTTGGDAVEGGSTQNDHPGHSGTSKPQQKNNNKKRKRNQNADNEDDNRIKSKNQHEGRNKKSWRKVDPQALIRNLDATPELVGVSADDDFSTLLIKHVEHSNKVLQRDLEKQSKMMMEEQKKQAKLLASQAAQLSDPQAAAQAAQKQQQQQQKQQQQQQQQKKPPNKTKTPFVPRKDCTYFLKGYCKNDNECTFRHDAAARAAFQAQETGDVKVSEAPDLEQAAMHAM
ncbi:hypothetical protein BGZ49_002860 [Haplosporangium sp. Z 27]|nr:hypothetical protein BGZ49_002860 [Haplosporangium sp. Z 27]